MPRRLPAFTLGAEAPAWADPWDSPAAEPETLAALVEAEDASYVSEGAMHKPKPLPWEPGGEVVGDQRKSDGKATERQALDLLATYGWRHVHFRTVRSAGGGWWTPLAGDKGFVDIVAAKDGRLLFLECKEGQGRLTADQRAWRDALRACPGVEYLVVREAMLDDDGDGCALARLLR